MPNLGASGDFTYCCLAQFFATCDGEFNGNGQYLMTHA
jgi:hypothetical protein